MRRTRRRWGLCALLQIHHVIPRQWETHAVIARANFDIEQRDNLLFMPTTYAWHVARLRDGRLLHDGGHPRYNKYVKERLDALQSSTSQDHDLRDLVVELRHRLRATHSDLPWR